ncbi:type VI secretion protein, partial [Pseudomonas syringae pv. actinidiae ICMP 18804]
KLQLSLPIHSLPKPLLGGPPVLLGMTGVLGLGSETWQVGKHEVITINLGRYQGLHSNPHSREVQHVAYRF